MEFFENIKNHILEFWDNSTGLVKTLVLILMFLIVSAVIAVPFSISFTKKKNTDIPYTKEFIKTQDFFVPEDVPLTKDYYLERETDKKWTQEESREWFTLPDENSINELGKQNDRLVEEITGAAP